MLKDKYSKKLRPGERDLFFDWGSKSRGPHFEESTNLL